MSFRKSSISAVVASAAVVGVAWLHAEVKLIDPIYNYGTISELAGPQHGTARLVNYGPDTIEMTDVRPSCGCTSADFIPGPLAPGDTAVIGFTYDPRNRPGDISKSVKVYIEPGQQRFIVRLAGRVVGSKATLSRDYPLECGPLRLSDRVIELKDVRPNTGRHSFVRLVNQSMDSITPVWIFDNPALSIASTPEKLAPGEIGSMGIFLNTRFEPRSGLVEYRIPVTTQPLYQTEADPKFGEQRDTVVITLRANILPPDTIAHN
ncbi:MAG: DUF1573 domain-containing protein [Muribaculaceae bacterium]|nr:DUF1573 domain-containing protein [Muribaculaceae bacterium]